MATEYTTTKQGPLYRQIAEELTRSLPSHPVGSILPTEQQLAKKLAVSKSTIRSALHLMVEQGLIERVKRLGTRVLKHSPSLRYEQRMDGIDNILAFADRSVLQINYQHKLPVSALDTSDITEFTDGTGQWIVLTGVRRLTEETQSSTWTRMYLPGRFSAVGAHIPVELDALYKVVEQMYGIEVVRLDHSISAVAIPEEAARELGLAVGTPVLQVKAWLYDRDNKLVEYVCSLHNPDKVSIRISTIQAI